MRVSQIHQTNRRPSIHRVLLVSVLFFFIYIYICICILQVLERKAAADLSIPFMIHVNAITFKPQP